MKEVVNMLALTRKKDEAIIINGNIEVKILDVLGDKVRIGISAPKEIEIYREEVYIQVLESNRSAMNTSKQGMEAIKKLMR